MPPVYEQRGAAPGVDPNVILVRLEDAIGSLRTGLTIVGVIAVAALAVAIYALVQANDSSSAGSRNGLATDSRVSQLEDRVDRLSRQVQDLRSGGGGDSAALDSRIAALERTVKTLASRPSTDPTPAIDELSGRLDALSKDVEQLKQTQTPP
ncbi:MAG: hypothetical protein QOH83_330 [Solirubrobacteraceae bacterium]|jgi:polyhydroxyalkanoate synthesis regulator phasin|nr:hypothetical protein [Solirubrobacteraceae bacterium]